MLGLNDRSPARAGARQIDKPADKKGDKKDARAKPDAKPADGAADGAAKTGDKPVDTGVAGRGRQHAGHRAGEGARSPNGLYEFREERWVELYNKKIEEMIGVLKSKGVPVLSSACRDPRPKRHCRHAVPGCAVSRPPPPRPALPMSTSGTALSMKPAASCRRVLTSKARSASCDV
jgi:hypothetical protein